MADAVENASLERLLGYIKQARRFDFSGYKRTSLERRIRKRMEKVGAADFDAYRDRLEVDPAEFEALFNTILINVTTFFRDPEAWDYVAENIIPEIIRSKAGATAASYARAASDAGGDSIRVWCAGCASGEEAYTLAMLFAEQMKPADFHRQVKVYATDVDEEALSQARASTYSQQQVASVPEPLREKYFERSVDRYTVKPGLRRALIFGRHDLVRDSPISRLDLLVCRNALMYFNAETQMRSVARLHFALQPNACIFLGRAEMLLAKVPLFQVVSLKHRLFRKLPRVGLRERLALAANVVPHEPFTAPHPVQHHQEIPLQSKSAAQVIVDRRGVLSLINEEARRLFALTEEDLGKRFADLELSYMPIELRGRIDEALRHQRTVRIENVQRDGATGHGSSHSGDQQAQVFDVLLAPLADQCGEVAGTCITFLDVTSHEHMRCEMERITHELETAYEELQSTNEELETTNEELQSTNEELETTNAELRTANQELNSLNRTVSHTNEELLAVNESLQIRTRELVRSNALLASILGSIRLGAVTVDQELRILTWNRRAEEFWGVPSAEAVGQFLLNLDIGLPVERLKQPLREVLERGRRQSELFLPSVLHDGRPCHVRIILSPLLMPDGGCSGVSILMEESSPDTNPAMHPK